MSNVYDSSLQYWIIALIVWGCVGYVVAFISQAYAQTESSGAGAGVFGCIFFGAIILGIVCGALWVIKFLWSIV